jgi:transcriptional regulator with XRE-family HTH domain
MEWNDGPSIDARTLRALLAAERVTHSEYARRCKLSRVYISRILSERAKPGELAQLKLLRGLRALGLDHTAVPNEAA